MCGVCGERGIRKKRKEKTRNGANEDCKKVRVWVKKTIEARSQVVRVELYKHNVWGRAKEDGIKKRNKRGHLRSERSN